MKKGVTAIAVLIVIGIAVFMYMNSRKGMTGGESYPYSYTEYINNPDWRGGETNPLLSPELFTGKVREAYAAAAEIPDVLDHMYCYCYCAEGVGHKSLLTCFTDDHGSGCDICMDEALRAYQLHQEGQSIKEIRAKIDKEFFRPYRHH